MNAVKSETLDDQKWSKGQGDATVYYIGIKAEVGPFVPVALDLDLSCYPQIRAHIQSQRNKK